MLQLLMPRSGGFPNGTSELDPTARGRAALPDAGEAVGASRAAGIGEGWIFSVRFGCVRGDGDGVQPVRGLMSTNTQEPRANPESLSRPQHSPEPRSSPAWPEHSASRERNSNKSDQQQELLIYKEQRVF